MATNETVDEKIVTDTSDENKESLPVNMILDGVEGFSKLLDLQSKNEKGKHCSFWVPPAQSPKNKVFDSFTRFWKEEILTDLTLLVGPDQTPIKVHKFILATNFDYFKAMFTSDFVESSQNAVSLPCISPGDFKLLLKYAYSGEPHLTTETVFKMGILANYFGCKNLLNKCCEFIRKFTGRKNCIKLLEAAFRLDINQLKKDLVLFVVDSSLFSLFLDDCNLPVDLLLEIIQHPAAAIGHDIRECEKSLFYFIWKKVKYLPAEERDKYIPKIFKAIHLPVTDKHFLFSMLAQFEHIPEAKELIMEAGKKIGPMETREWYLERYFSEAKLEIYLHHTREKNGYYKYSRCVLVKGLPFYMYVSCSSDFQNYLNVESPVAIEHLGLPCRVNVHVRLDPQSQWISANTYHNGVVEKSPVPLQTEREVEVKVMFQS